MPATSPTTIPEYIVSGQITDQFNVPLIGVKVQAFDKKLRTSQPLGMAAVTDNKGYYKITFLFIGILGEYKTPDVFITVTNTQGLQLGQSSINFNIVGEATINLQIISLDEFTQLKNIMNPLVENSDMTHPLEIKDLEESEKNKDISFLAAETGIDKERIMMLVKAHRLDDKYKTIPASTSAASSSANTAPIIASPEFYYALLRSGYDIRPDSFPQISTADLKNSFLKSIEDKIIPETLSASLDATIKRFSQIMVQDILKAGNSKNEKFKTAFAPAFPTLQLQQEFLEEYLNSKSTPAKFWSNLSQRPGFTDGKAVAAAKKILQISLLTGNQPDLTAQLYKDQPPNGEWNLRSFVAYNVDDWKAAIRKASVIDFPGNIEGSTNEERIANYAGLLGNRINELYPVDVFTHRLKADNSSHWANVKSDLLVFLQNNPSFDLKTNSIKKNLSLANFNGITGKDLVEKELTACNHLCKLSNNNFKVVTELRQKNIGSAIDIIKNYSKNAFKGTFARLIGMDTAELIFDSAKQVDNLATAVLVNCKNSLDINTQATWKEGSASEDYRKWFGTGNLCDCDECQSVYSPVAYFTDIMRFLQDDQNPNEGDSTFQSRAFSRLMEVETMPGMPKRTRRPDLQNIQLTCQNFNTPLPYIDLVNELLEKEVIKAAGILDTEVILSTDHSYQTTGTAEELAAIPEHISSNAYTALTTVDETLVLSAALPMDLPLEEIRMYCAKLGFQRYELMEYFYGQKTPGIYKDMVIATELLQFSSSEWKVVNGLSPFSIPLPPNVAGVLQQTGLSYIELCQVLECYFLNPRDDDNNKKLSIAQPIGLTDVSCDIDILFIARADDAWMNKLIRFLRMWRKLDWPLFDLDRILTAMGVTDFPSSAEEVNTKILLPLSHVARLQQRLKLPLRLIAVLFSDIDTRIYRDQSMEGQPEQPSLYQQLFRNKAVTNPLDTAFAENGPLPEKISSHIVAICAAFEVTQIDLELLFDDTENLSFNTISKIYRFILLSGSLKVSVSELQYIVKLTGSDPFVSPNTSVLLEFLDRVNEIRSSGFTINELNYLLCHISDKSFQAPAPAQIAISLFKIREGLKKLKDEKNLKEAEKNLSEANKILWEENRLEYQSKAALTVADMLTVTMNIDTQIVHSLLTKMLAVPGDPENNKIISLFISDAFVNSGAAATMDLANEITKLFPALGQSWIRLYKTCYLLKKLQFQSDEVDWLYENREKLIISAAWELPVDNTNSLKVNTISNLFCLPELRKTNPDSDHKWYDISGYAITSDDTSKKNFIETMTELYSVSESSLVFLLGKKEDTTDIGQMKARFKDDYLNQAFMLSVLNSCKIMEILGTSKEQLESFINEESDTKDAQVARNVLKVKYSNAEWLKIIKPVSDQMREKRRNCLLDYLVAKKRDQYPDRNSVYEWLLIDAEMDSCMITSRGKQAIATVQSYVVRCMMGLEQDISLDNDFVSQWEEWRDRFTLWAANRMVFISPENWILPELRRKKSPFFKELESKLLQNEITDEAAGDAMKEYLEKLDEVAKLNIECVYKENNEDGEIVHLLASTINTPCKYFYRKKVNKIWEPWEKVDVDIQGNHILMFVHNNQLQLAWAIFNQKQVNSDTFKVPGVGGIIKSGQIYWEVKVAYSEFKKGRWTSKKMFKEVLQWDTEEQHTVIKLMNVADFFQFQFYNSMYGCLTGGIPFFKEKALVLPPNTARHGSANNTFLNDLSDPDTDPGTGPVVPLNLPTIEVKSNRTGYWSPKGTVFMDMKIVESDSSTKELYLFKKGTVEYARNFRTPEEETVQLFLKTPGKFSITPPQNDTRMLSLEPFGYQDANGSFIVYPSADLATGDPDGAALLSGDSISSYLFESMYHPYSDKLRKIYDREGIDGLYDKDVQTEINSELFSEFAYGPQPPITEPYPVECFDFSLSGAYSIYNWELFFHIPFLIAKQLSNNQQFKEARKWYHYIFNPTRHPSEGEMDADRYWITKPFMDELQNGIKTIDKILGGNTGGDLIDQVTEWATHPFDPHAVAAMRPAAYMRAIIMNYIDNLIAWGDKLFKTDTLETINEATLLYVTAGNMLGKQPENIPPTKQPGVMTFKGIANGLDPFSEIKVEIASNISAGDSNPGTGGDSQLLMPLFNIPKNKQLLAKWDTVADRLFKIRHCQNIGGQIQQLPLFEKIIDPALLVKAKALGLDINSVLREIEIPLPNYRFQVMLQKANELCNDVKGLGNALLSVLEKKDAEELSLIRSQHELNILGAMKDIKSNQRDEAEQNLEGLNKSREVISFRKDFYLSRPYKNASEKEYLKSLGYAEISQDAASAAELIANTFFITTPDVTTGAWSWGFTYGGTQIGGAAKAVASSFGALANYYNNKAAKASASGSYERRSDDWKFQAQSADLELKQLDKQILAAEIRLALAERDLEIHEQQIDNAREVNDYMHEKFTNKELYSWMLEQVSNIYFQSYQLAYDTAKKAEKCLQHELGSDNSNYVQFGYWDSLKKGLLSGEKLQYDLRRLENAYLEQNKREFEITKHISLSLLNPYELLKLKETGTCEITIPEELFDLDFPGHYFRRIKSVSISIPCIAGPYTSVNASLRLTKNEYRLKVDSSEYKKTGDDDSRFKTVINPISAIATSNAQNDSGVFELNFRDERYLPFEGSGATSTWKLELVEEKALRQFDYNSISDIILHLKYTSREDSTLKTVAIKNLDTILTSATEGKIFGRLLSLKNDFPDEFYRLLNSNPQPVEFELTNDFFPYFLIDKLLSMSEVKVYLKPKRNMAITIPDTVLTKISDATVSWNIVDDIPSSEDVSVNDKIRGGTVNLTGSPFKKWKIDAGNNGIDKDNIDDILILINYKID